MTVCTVDPAAVIVAEMCSAIASNQDRVGFPVAHLGRLGPNSGTSSS